jgi:hypothetical protein
MEKIAANIVSIIGDYHNYNGFQITPNDVLSWVDQFDEADRLFILEEFCHLLNQGIYISESEGRKLLMDRLSELAKFHGFKSVSSFLDNSEFLALQGPDKSQTVLLELIDQEIKKRGHGGINSCGPKSKSIRFISMI